MAIIFSMRFYVLYERKFIPKPKANKRLLMKQQPTKQYEKPSKSIR